MYKIGVTLFLLFSVVLFSACGNRKTSACVTAYDNATSKVLMAESSEALLEIAYDLHLELMEIEGIADADEARRVVEARQEFETAVKKKEMEFYSHKHKKR